MSTWSAAVPLRYILSPREDTNHADLRVLSVYREYGVIPKDSREDNFNKTPIDLSRYQRVRVGDLVVNKMKAWQGSLGISDFVGIVSPDYLVCSVVKNIHGPYLHYLLRSSPLIAEYHKLAQGIRPAQWRIYWDDLARIRVDLPPIEYQRRVADFLEAETARIDALITKKRCLMNVLRERFTAWLSGYLATRTDEGIIPLKHCTDPARPIMYGIVLPGPDVDDGVLLVKGGDVKRNLIHPAVLAKTTYEIDALHARSRLRADDLVFAIRGGVGDVALVPPDTTGANITQDVARVSCDAKFSARWLMHYMRTSHFQSDTNMRITGATIKGLNIEDLKRLTVPLRRRNIQDGEAQIVDDRWQSVESVTNKLSRQLALLQEHRQALITAAVTGELDIPAKSAG